MSCNIKKEKEKVKHWLINAAKNLSVEKTTFFLKDYTYSFIDECVKDLKEEGYNIVFFEETK